MGYKKRNVVLHHIPLFPYTFIPKTIQGTLRKEYFSDKQDQKISPKVLEYSPLFSPKAFNP